MELTPTSYAILGLLAGRPWSAYELATHWERGDLALILPRSRSNIYREPKRLESGGYATSTTEPSPNLFGRTRTRYEITEKGEAGLEAWLASDPQGESVSVSEALLRVSLVDPADEKRTLAVLNRVRDQVTMQLAHISTQPIEDTKTTARSIDISRLQRRLFELVNHAMLTWCDEATTVIGGWGESNGGT